MSNEQQLTRRELLHHAVRFLLLGGVVAGLAALVTRPKSAVCSADGICRRCGQVASCGLPQALSYKHEMATHSHGR